MFTDVILKVIKVKTTKYYFVVLTLSIFTLSIRITYEVSPIFYALFYIHALCGYLLGINEESV